MTSFIATVTDRRLADQLERAVQGRGAFRRFRDTLSGADDEFTRWHRFAADRQRGRPEPGSLTTATNHDQDQLVARAGNLCATTFRGRRRDQGSPYSG